MSTNSNPSGYQTVIPYLTVPGVPTLIPFLIAAFGATERLRSERPDGTVMHAEVQLGDSVVMMGEPGDAADSRPASLYLSVDDVDATYARALDAGATSLREPADQSYGERSAGVVDPSGNIWWLAAPRPLPGRSGVLFEWSFTGRAVCRGAGRCGRLPMAKEASRVGTARKPLPWPAAGRCGFPSSEGHAR